MTDTDKINIDDLDNGSKKSLIDLSHSIFENSNIRTDDNRRDEIVRDILNDAILDLLAYHQRDPSIRNKPISCLISQYSTYFAVLSYRIAHKLIKTGDSDCCAIHISYAARSITGTEIHPEAIIGKRFVIDHGWGTVVGQTTEIGDDCYLLNNVTLGGRSAANAPDGKRHPTILNRVEICAGANIFGPVQIGDDCFIGPNVTITEDVSKETKVLRSGSYRFDDFDGNLEKKAG